MKIQQETPPFRPITIKLEKQSEAIALFGLVEKLDAFINNENAELPYDSFTEEEEAILIAMSNARTNQEIVI